MFGTKSTTNSTLNPTYTSASYSGPTITGLGSPGVISTSTISKSTIDNKLLRVNGDAWVSGELTVGGVNLSERLNKIEERLGILHPNQELEQRWENLREARNKYLELEREIIEQEKMWAILKK